MSESDPSFDGRLKDSLTWWLGKKKPFIINNEYEIRLLFIDKINHSAKIQVTNLKTQETHEVKWGVLGD